jgi:hypothetical protein
VVRAGSCAPDEELLLVMDEVVVELVAAVDVRPPTLVVDDVPIEDAVPTAGPLGNAMSRAIDTAATQHAVDMGSLPDIEGPFLASRSRFDPCERERRDS